MPLTLGALIECVDAVGETCRGSVVRLALRLEQRAVQLEEFEVGLGRRVDEAPLSSLKRSRGHVDGFEAKRHEALDREGRLLIAQVHARQEAKGDTGKSLLGPRLKPVNRRAVDEGGELAGTRAESVAHGRAA